MSRLWEKVNYRSNTNFVIDMPIREFDITKANISVLRDANMISESQYQYLLRCPKQERSITIGKMQGANPEITKVLKAGIMNAKKVFMETNNINDSEVLAIRNDAIMIIGNKPVNTLQITDRVSFRQSACYTSFYHVGFIDLYYFYDQVTNTEVLDVKGLSDEAIELHKDYLLEFLAELFYCAQVDGVKQAINLLSNVWENYIRKNLPIDYYRELNSESKYRMLPEFSMYQSIYAYRLNEYDKKYIDIGYNANILREIAQMLSSVYFATK